MTREQALAALERLDRDCHGGVHSWQVPISIVWKMDPDLRTAGGSGIALAHALRQNRLDWKHMKKCWNGIVERRHRPEVEAWLKVNARPVVEFLMQHQKESPKDA